jgi:hypothetical protein
LDSRSRGLPRWGVETVEQFAGIDIQAVRQLEDVEQA